MNITLSIDEKIVKQARKVAQAQGKSLNQMIRDYLHQMTAQGDAQNEMKELRELSTRGQGKSAGWRFNREEIHEKT